LGPKSRVVAAAATRAGVGLRRRHATWGRIGTIAGGAIGALIVSFIQTGDVGAGWSGFYIQFFYGMIIILSLLGHRWNQVRYRWRHAAFWNRAPEVRRRREAIEQHRVIGRSAGMRSSPAY
jgi:hypothetical protein